MLRAAAVHNNISYPQIKLSSVWKAHEANKQAADHCWLPHPWQGTTTSPKYQITTSDLIPVCREGGAEVRFFFLKGHNYCIQSCSNHNSPSHTILAHVHLLPIPLLFGILQWWGLFYFSKPTEKHLQCFCSPVGWLYYVYFEINSSNRSSCNKQIFAVALCLYKLRCSSNTLKSSLSCCLHSQMIRKSVKMLNFRCPGRSSQQHNSPRSQGMPFPEAALVKQGEAEIKGRAPPPTPLRAAMHSHIISFTGSCR